MSSIAKTEEKFEHDSYTTDMNDSPILRIVWQFFKKVYLELTYYLEILLPGIYPENLKADPNKILTNKCS